MNRAEIVNTLMFNYDVLSPGEIDRLCEDLPPQMLRWLGMNHPDNAMRPVFYAKTGVELGDDVVINMNFVVSDGFRPLLKIGNRVAISPNVTVACESKPSHSRLKDHPYVKDALIVQKPVVIEDDVWIGTNVVILSGITIGTGSVIGAGAVVYHSIPPFSIAAGVPARVIRTLEPLPVS